MTRDQLSALVEWANGTFALREVRIFNAFLDGWHNPDHHIPVLLAAEGSIREEQDQAWISNAETWYRQLEDILGRVEILPHHVLHYALDAAATHVIWSKPAASVRH